MKGDLILHEVHISGTIMIESGTDGISMGGNLGVMMNGLNPLQFSPLYQGLVEISTWVELRLMLWLEIFLARKTPSDRFE